MKAIFLATVLLMVTTDSMCVEWGGIQLIIKQAGLNKVTDYIHEHLAHLLRQTSFGDRKFMSLNINDIHLVSTDGLYTTVVLKPNNTIEVTAVFKTIHIQANVTVLDPGDILRSPKTVVNLTDASMQFTLQIGRRNGTRVHVESCNASVGDMQLETDSNEIHDILKTTWRLGRNDFAKYLGNLCPLFHNYARDQLSSLKGSSVIRGDGPKLPVEFKLNNMSTDNNRIDVLAVVGIKGSDMPDYGSGGVEFPDPTQLGYDNTKEVEAWFGQDFLDLIFPRAMYIETGFPTSFMAFASDYNDTLLTTYSKNYSVVCTKDGIALQLSFNSTLIQQSNTSKHCVALNTTTVAILPFVLTINNTRFEARPDPTRYSINTTVTYWDVAYAQCGPIDPDKDALLWQKQMLRNFTRAFEKFYNHQLVYMDLLYETSFFGQSQTTVDTLKDSVVITANLALGGNITTEDTIRTVHSRYTHRRVQYTYSDNTQEILIDRQPLQPSPPQAPGNCDTKSTNVVPIVVGSIVGVAALVVLVLLAFVLIGRVRKSAKYRDITNEEDDDHLLTVE